MLSQERAIALNTIEIPEIYLLKDGGAIKGIDECYAETIHSFVPK